MSTVTCREADRVVAFLAGELSPEEERAYDEHLLTCETCWLAVREDRASRLALERLRDSAPPGLEGRVRLAVALADHPGAGADGYRGHRTVTGGLSRPRRLVAAAVVGFALGGSLLGYELAVQPASDPAQIAAVVAMASHQSAPSTALLTGERLMIDGQAVLVRAFMVNGKEAITATSGVPFAMPAASHLLTGSSTTAWMATRGSLSLYGVNRPAGRRSMFVVAAMPVAELPAVAARLHLI
jgi:hypothetical protein